MRILLAAGLCMSFAASAAAQPAPSAQTAFVERRGLLAADASCGFLAPDLRLAIEGGAAQARGALLRGGWTVARITELDQAAAQAARARACTDARTMEAAAQARLAFASWSRAPSMTFPGGERSWTARRAPDAQGWRLSQAFPAPQGAAFGVRDRNGAQELALLIPLAANDSLAPSAELVLRDPARAQANFDIPGRAVRGLAAGAPSPASAQRFWASGRRIETIDRRRWAVFVFPDAAFQTLLALDPREAIEARVGADNTAQRLLIEVGDVAAARAFLAVSAR